MVNAPQFNYDIKLVVLACYVRELDFHAQKFDDVLVLVDDYLELPFEPFEQVPLCNYTSWYTITLYEKVSTGLHDVPFTVQDEGNTFGSPQLVSLDLDGGLIVIDASDPALADRTFQVVINCNIGVDKSVQSKFSDYMTPFDVTVASSLDLYKPGNKGPIIDQFIKTINLIAGQPSTVKVGKVVDFELDAVYLKSWALLDGVAQPKWLSVKNSTIETSLEIQFNPPLSSQGTNFTIEMVLGDLNEQNPQTSKYKIDVHVQTNNSTFVPVYSQVQSKDADKQTV